MADNVYPTQSVRVYDGDRTEFSEGLGKIDFAPLPASIPKIDLSALGNALNIESEMAGSALKTIEMNIEKFAKMQDDLTGIEVSNPYQSERLEKAKKAHGIDREAYSNALAGVDNPAAMYDLDRKIKRLASDPLIRNIAHENAVIETFRQNLHNIEDPALRTAAAEALINVMTDTDGTHKVESLSIGDYKPIDLAAAYTAVADQFAPKVSKEEIRYDKDGVPYVVQVKARDPNMLKRSREQFMKNPIVMNNLKARGIINEKGELELSEGKSFFDLIEEGLSEEETNITNYNPSRAGGNGPGTVANGTLQFDSWTPNEVQGFDLGLVSQAETGGRNPEHVVHVDPGNNAINFGAYSFNGGPDGAASGYFKWLLQKNPDNAAIKQLAMMDLKDKKNLTKAKELYAQVESDLSVSGLHGMESTYAVEKYGNPIVAAASKAGLTNLTPGERTVLFDSSIQHGVGATSKWVTEYASAKDPGTLIDFITKKRSKLANGRYANRAYTVAHNAQSLGKAETEEPVAEHKVDMSIYEGVLQ